MITWKATAHQKMLLMGLTFLELHNCHLPLINTMTKNIKYYIISIQSLSFDITSLLKYCSKIFYFIIKCPDTIEKYKVCLHTLFTVNVLQSWAKHLVNSDLELNLVHYKNVKTFFVILQALLKKRFL